MNTVKNLLSNLNENLNKNPDFLTCDSKDFKENTISPYIRRLMVIILKEQKDIEQKNGNLSII